MFKIYKQSKVNIVRKTQFSDMREFKVEVFITSNQLNTNSMIVDFKKIEDVIQKYQLAYLDQILEEPTTEKFAELIHEKIYELVEKQYENFVERRQDTIHFSVKIRVWDDKTSYVEFEL